MGWKSTVDITRSEAKRLILEKVVILDKSTNEELAEAVEALGYGENTDLQYFGHNFIVVDDKQENIN